MRKGKILVVGATGLLGSEIVRQLAAANRPVRAVVRAAADQTKRSLVAYPGVEVFTADLKDPSSLATACQGVAAVISTATATVSRQEGDSIEAVDQAGQLALVEAAERQGVEHFVFLSFPATQPDYALQRAKRAVEARLHTGTMSYTILQAADFIEVWLSPALGFDPLNGKARLLGDGTSPVSWISLHDVARFAVAALDNPLLARKVLALGGPDPLSPKQVLEIFRELGGPAVTVDYVPESVLESQLAGARNSLEEAFAAIMLAVARGQVVDPSPALAVLPGRLGTVRDFAGRLVRGSTQDARS
jgi:uncharacterized protein YbjT (DUF2867 family)